MPCRSSRRNYEFPIGWWSFRFGRSLQRARKSQSWLWRIRHFFLANRQLLCIELLDLLVRLAYSRFGCFFLLVQRLSAIHLVGRAKALIIGYSIEPFAIAHGLTFCMYLIPRHYWIGIHHIFMDTSYAAKCMQRICCAARQPRHSGCDELEQNVCRNTSAHTHSRPNIGNNIKNRTKNHIK